MKTLAILSRKGGAVEQARGQAMAGRAKLTSEKVKAAKTAQEATGAASRPAEGGRDPNPAEGLPGSVLSPRGRGRPPKRTAVRTFGLTVRIDGDLRSQLRRLAEAETDRCGAVVSLNDLLIEAAVELLKRKGRS